MTAPHKVLATGLILTWLVGCARVEPPTIPVDNSHIASSALLTSVPFHPQAERDDCGPAALAMMLGWTGIDTDPATVAPTVYTPGREGTLQSDIVQATRRAGRLAIPVHSLTDLLTELDAGHPVLVLQNLGFERWPVWHYAVAIGYDLESRTLMLHSGRDAELATSFSDFEKSWRSSKRWGLTVTKPGQLPATLDQTEVLEAANGLEQAGQQTAAAMAYSSLLDRWPDSLAALMGLGNTRYATGDIDSTRKIFRQAVTLHPSSADAWNNLAVSLAEDGQPEAALQAAKRAVQLGGPNKAVALATLKEMEALVDEEVVK